MSELTLTFVTLCTASSVANTINIVERHITCREPTSRRLPLLGLAAAGTCWQDARDLPPSGRWTARETMRTGTTWLGTVTQARHGPHTLQTRSPANRRCYLLQGRLPLSLCQHPEGTAGCLTDDATAVDRRRPEQNRQQALSQQHSTTADVGYLM